MLRRVLITDCDHGDVDEERAVLDAAGVQFRVAECRTPQDVAREARDAPVLINQYAPITAEALDALPALRLVVRYGVGVDNVDVPAATERGVWVANVPDYGTEEVADHTLALALSLLRGVATLDRSVRAGRWKYEDSRPLRRLSTLTYGVVGCGAIGSAVALRAHAFGFRVVGCDLLAARPAVPGVEKVSLDELLHVSDVVSVHAILDERSAGLLGAAAFEAMRPSAIVVNTARGGLVDSAALLQALDGGAIAGAALDVLQREPPDELGRRLAAHPRVVVTPHAAWYSEESFSTLKSEVAREAVRVLDGSAPRSPVNTPIPLAS